jgi:hypothetical protein
MKDSADGVNCVFTWVAMAIYTAIWKRGTSGLMWMVLGIGQIATHCGSEKKPMHSVHFVGSILKTKFFSTIA